MQAFAVMRKPVFVKATKIFIRSYFTQHPLSNNRDLVYHG